MNCPKCGVEVDARSVYCPKCGERLDSGDQEFFVPRAGGLGKPATATPAAVGPAEALFQPTAEAAQSPQAAADARSRIQQMVEADRETLWQGRYSFKGILPWMILAGLVLILLAFIGWWLGGHQWQWWAQWGGKWFWRISWIGVVLVWLYQLALYGWRRLGHGYRLTPQTFFHEKGIIFRSTSPIEIVSIDDMTFQQTILERLFGVGTIQLLSKDTSDPTLVMKGIPNVKEAFARIDQARRAERRARAVRIDNV
ncbi:MAG: PH domain-containing protein [Thermoguttaceae bacterium]